MPIAAQTRRPVLQFDAVIDPFGHLELVVHRGELVLALCPDRTDMARLSRLAAGMELVGAGEVRMEEDWTAVDPDHAARLRGALGLAPLRSAWVNHLTLLQNLMLAPLHHGSRSRAAIADEAASLCRTMGLPGVPLCRPEQASAEELGRAAIARAFMGDKRLVILEEPNVSMMAPVVNLCRELCRRGGAALWMTSDRRLWGDPPFAARRVRLGRRPGEAAA